MSNTSIQTVSGARDGIRYGGGWQGRTHFHWSYDKLTDRARIWSRPSGANQAREVQDPALAFAVAALVRARLDAAAATTSAQTP